MPLTLDAIRTRCRSLPGKVTEGFPFGEDALVFKAGGKMFLLAMISTAPLRINVKCDPELAIEYRERYEAVTPGYHMNKRHWNTVVLDGSVPSSEVLKMIDHSFALVAKPGTTRGPKYRRSVRPR